LAANQAGDLQEETALLLDMHQEKRQNTRVVGCPFWGKPGFTPNWGFLKMGESQWNLGYPLRTWRPETPPSIAMRLAMARPYAEMIWPSGHLKSDSCGCTIMGMTRFSYVHHI